LHLLNMTALLVHINDLIFKGFRLMFAELTINTGNFSYTCPFSCI
jgi:hypothetical protein